MSTKERQLVINGLRAATSLDTLKAELERFGPLQNCFIQNPGNNLVRATFINIQDAQAAHRAMDGRSFDFGRMRMNFASNKKPSGAQSGGSSSNAHGWQTSQQHQQQRQQQVEEEDPNRPRPIAPAPQIVEPVASTSNEEGEAAAAAAANGTSDGSTSNAFTFPRDTWEISLEDSDYDDGFVPYNPKNKPKPVTVQEWREAFDLLKSFSHLGGAILAVDVESWDQDHDYIIEVGLAHVKYTPGSSDPPKVRAEHIIITENEDKVNGTYSANAREHFAFGKSKRMSDFDTGVYLRFLMNKYSEDQPLILLFHNAAAEKGYFELLDIPLSSLCVEAIPHKLLSANVYTNNSDGTRDGAPPMPAHLAIPTPRGPERSAKIILDTQRLYKAFVLDENDKNTKLGLANICRKLGIHTKHLHNAGNDALYTLRVLFKLAEKQMERTKVKVEDETG